MATRTRKTPRADGPKRPRRPRGAKTTASVRQSRTDTADPVFTAGLAVRRAMWGRAGAEQQIEAASDFLWPMQEVVTRYCFGETWTRKGLSRKTRSMITLAILVALARPHELKVHVRGALANGVTVAEIQEILRHAMVYCGVPQGVEAFRSAEDVLKEIGLVT